MVCNREMNTKNALLNLLREKRINNPLAVTLTLKRAYKVKTEFGSFVHYPDLIEYQKNNRLFFNILNTRVFGKGFTRYQKQLAVFPIFEGSKTVRTHVHLALERPDRFATVDFANLVEACWQKTNLGYSNVDIQEINNYDAWITYITKRRTKNIDLLSCVDVENMYL